MKYLLLLSIILAAASQVPAQSHRFQNYSESAARTEKVPESAAQIKTPAKPDDVIHVDTDLVTIPVRISDLEADLVTVSAHKIGGPQGAGALILRDQTLGFPAPDPTG